MPQTMENVKQDIHIITEISITEQFLSVLKRVSVLQKSTLK